MTQQLQPAKAFIWCAEDLLDKIVRNDVTVYANIDDISIIHPEVKGVMFSLRTVELLDWLGLAERPPCTLSNEHFVHIGHIHRDWTGWAEVNQSYFDHIKITGKMVEGYLFKDKDGQVVFQTQWQAWEGKKRMELLKQRDGKSPMEDKKHPYPLRKFHDGKKRKD